MENELHSLEDEINRWIEQTGASIVSVHGNMSPQSMSPEESSPGLSRTGFPPSDVLLVILYETT